MLLGKQRLKMEWARKHREPACRIARPCCFRAVPIQLDAVAVRIAQVERLAHAVIARAFERNPGGRETPQRIRERRARGIKDRQMIKPGGSVRRWLPAGAVPCV